MKNSKLFILKKVMASDDEPEVWGLIWKRDRLEKTE